MKTEPGHSPLALVALVFCGVVLVIFLHRQGVIEWTRRPEKAHGPRTSLVKENRQPPRIEGVEFKREVSAGPQGEPVQVPFSGKNVPPPVQPAASSPPPSPPVAGGSSAGKAPAQDPMAREALFFVGADPDADAYWFAAINDPNLPAEERKDLIEDLNEAGFADPKNPTADDLPLIVSRLALIEELAAETMDKVNADAFAEAYKDLLNMFNRVTEQK